MVPGFFLKQTRTDYNAELEAVNFKTMCEAAWGNISSWVEKQTQGASHALTYTPSVYCITPSIPCNPDEQT